MAKSIQKPAPAEAPEGLDLSAVVDDGRYQVRLARKVERPNGVFLIPTEPTRVSGKVLKEIAADVAEFVAI